MIKARQEVLPGRRNNALKPGQLCSHSGCLHHVTHPCEVCGRIGGEE